MERVARALKPDAMRLPKSESLYREAVGLARAAIAAMREPTEAMLEVGPGEPYMDRAVWAKMVDEALSEP